MVNNQNKMDEFCKEKQLVGWFETSAKENINIDEAAKCLVSRVSKKLGKKKSVSKYLQKLHVVVHFRLLKTMPKDKHYWRGKHRMEPPPFQLTGRKKISRKNSAIFVNSGGKCAKVNYSCSRTSCIMDYFYRFVTENNIICAYFLGIF